MTKLSLSVQAAVVYVNLAGDLEVMAKNIVRAMKETGVKRIIAIGSIGIYDTPLKPALIPYQKLADVIESSGLDYAILRPDWFTDANEVDYVLTLKGQREWGTAISRKSIAAFVATLINILLFTKIRTWGSVSQIETFFRFRRFSGRHAERGQLRSITGTFYLEFDKNYCEIDVKWQFVFWHDCEDCNLQILKSNL